MDQPMPPENQTNQVDDPQVAVLPGATDWSPNPPAFVPERVFRPRDAVAAAIGNASLLSVGYLLLGRRLLAVLAMLGTVVLVTVVVAVPSVWFEVAVLAWWAAMIWHGWYLGGGRAGSVVRKHRRIALAVTVPVLLVFGLVRFDAARLEGHVTEARQQGDCARAETELAKVWFGHRVVDAPMTMRTDRTVDACRRLREASGRLNDSLAKGDTDALGAGFRGLNAVLAELPGHDKMVDVALDRFLGGLPTKDSCRTSSLTDWLKSRKPTGNGLDRAATVVPRVAPAALVGCADERMAANHFGHAQQRYQQLLDEYPGHELTGKAQEGVTKARLAAELAHVRNLHGGYCGQPAAYSGAPEFRKGAVNRAVIWGNREYVDKLPGDWLTHDVGEAVLVVCTGQTEFGAPTQTCPYRAASTGRVAGVTFRKIAIPVKAYELRTGKVVVDTKVEIGGESCPSTFLASADGPPPDRYVSPSDGDIRAGYAAVITP
ncbi:hypothetical protein FXN61_11405 [Lentzea sp. PSKA42]|uniref:Uncharacterized protein n=1 Tax=Lentzea indica TaxID=2604800 RepID=A0ABX1FF44_9PSEU|nr:hypothetical protein [Lentzea indica]NKE57410.1 hypothetical protein [Lentzea indica]